MAYCAKYRKNLRKGSPKLSREVKDGHTEEEHASGFWNKFCQGKGVVNGNNI